MTQPVDAETVCYPKAVPNAYGDSVVRKLMDDLGKALEPAILKALVTHTGIDLKDPWDRVRAGDHVTMPGAVIGECYGDGGSQKDPVREAVERATEGSDDKECLEWVELSARVRKALGKHSDHADETEWCSWIQKAGSILIGLEAETLDGCPPQHYVLSEVPVQATEKHRELQHRNVGAYLRDCVYLDRALRGFVQNQERMSSVELEIMLKDILLELRKLRPDETDPYTAVVALSSEVEKLRSAAAKALELDAWVKTQQETREAEVAERKLIVSELASLKGAIGPIVEVCEGESLISPKTCREAVERVQQERTEQAILMGSIRALMERINGHQEVSASAIQQALDSLGPAPDF